MSGSGTAGSSAPHPFHDLTDSLLGWASQMELELAQAMADHPWFPAAGYSADQLERCERFFGIMLARQLAAGSDLAELLRIAPATTSATVIARAARLQDADSFAAEYLAGLGLEITDEAIAVVDAALLPALESAGLKVPEGATPVQAVVFQAGHTGGELADLVELLDVVHPLAPGMLPEDAPEWEASAVVALLATGEAPRLLRRSRGEDSEDTADGGEDQPTCLRQTSAVARLVPKALAELLDAVTALRIFSITHPTSWPDRDRTVIQPSLPPLVADAVVAELRERPVGTVGRDRAVGVGRRELRPRLVLDTVRGRVFLRLPEQRVASHAEPPVVAWRVGQAGTTREFVTGLPWGEDTYAEALDVAVEQPIREAQVTDSTNRITWTVPVVPAADPVLIFAANGQNLTDKVSLHHAELTVLSVADAQLMDVVTNQPIEVTRSFPVLGWDGWVARTIDAREVASIQAVRPGQAGTMVRHLRSVDPRQRVRFVHPVAALPELQTPGRLPVYAASLVAEFPPTLSGAAEHWSLSISAYGGVDHAEEEITEPELLEVPAEGGAFEIFDPEAYDAPWVGEYFIRLRGPRNESFRHRYAIVEGLRADVTVSGPSTKLRIPAQGGLSPVELRLQAGEKPCQIEPSVVSVAPDQASGALLISTEEGDQLPLRFVPAALRFELPYGGCGPDGSGWRTGRAYLGPKEWDTTGRVRVRATRAGLGSPRLALRNQHGSPLRTVPLERDDAVTYSAAAAPFAQAATTARNARLDLEWTDPRSHRAVSVTLAQLCEEPHAAGMSIEDGELVIEGLAELSLVAWVWPLTAPWAHARVLSPVAEHTPLPAGLINAGDLAVQLVSADPSGPPRAPRQPGSAAFHVAQEGFLADQGGELTLLSQLLAGEDVAPPTGAAVLPVIWDFFGAAGRQREVSQVVFAADPAAALYGLEQSLVPAAQQPGRMISTGLVNLNYTSPDGAQLSLHAHAEHSSQWLAALALLGTVPAILDADGDVRPVIQMLRQMGGDALANTLLTGRDVTLDTACIDASTVRISHMDAAQQEQLIKMFFASSDLVPGPFMEESARRMAVFETFRKRGELGALLLDTDVVKPAVKLMRIVRQTNRGPYAAARVRFDRLEGVDINDPQHVWALVPLISLVFALAARLHAHGLLGPNKTLDKHAGTWARMADLVPDLVAGDIVSAEAIALATRYASRLR